MAAKKKGPSGEIKRDPVPFKKFRYFNHSANTVTARVTLLRAGVPVPGAEDVPLDNGGLIVPNESPEQPFVHVDIDQVVVKTTVRNPPMNPRVIPAYTIGTIGTYLGEAQVFYLGENTYAETRRKAGRPKVLDRRHARRTPMPSLRKQKKLQKRKRLQRVKRLRAKES